MPITVTALPCLSDNYTWLLRAPDGRLAICDPGEAGPVIAAVDAAGGRLDLILLTHHHGDHVAGVADLVARYGSKVMGAKVDAHRLPPLDIAPFNWVPGIFWFVLKLCMVFFMFAMVKTMVPRYRYDQLMRLGWKVFLPISLFMVVATAAFVQFVA